MKHILIKLEDILKQDEYLKTNKVYICAREKVYFQKDSKTHLSGVDNWPFIIISRGGERVSEGPFNNIIKQIFTVNILVATRFFGADYKTALLGKDDYPGILDLTEKVREILWENKVLKKFEVDGSITKEYVLTNGMMPKWDVKEILIQSQSGYASAREIYLEYVRYKEYSYIR